MIMTAGKEGARETFPALFNSYVEALFMGYPHMITSWKMETAEAKAEDAAKLYKNVFNEEATF
jgi:hypothetical protein